MNKRFGKPRLRKKMTDGIVGLTRPRFGKRSRGKVINENSQVLRFLLSKLKRSPKTEEQNENLQDEEQNAR